MLKVYFIIEICFLVALELSCQTIHNEHSEFDKLKIISKKSFGFNSLIKSEGDTLELVSCSRNVIYPFGIINDELSIKSGLISMFSVVSNSIEDSIYRYVELKYKSSWLRLLFESDEDDADHSNIVEGVINDSDIVTINNIKVGMEIGSFYKIHFKSYPKDIEGKYKTIIFHYCIEGITHVYHFKNNKLIEFEYF